MPSFYEDNYVETRQPADSIRVPLGRSTPQSREKWNKYHASRKADRAAEKERLRIQQQGKHIDSLMRRESIRNIRGPLSKTGYQEQQMRDQYAQRKVPQDMRTAASLEAQVQQAKERAYREALAELQARNAPMAQAAPEVSQKYYRPEDNIVNFARQQFLPEYYK